MSSDFTEADRPDQTRFPDQDAPTRQPAANPGVDPVDPMGEPVVDPVDRPEYGSDPLVDPGIADDPRGDFAGGPVAGGAGGFDPPLPEPGAGPVGASTTDYPAGEPGGSVTGSETLDDPYGRPGVPGDRGDDAGVVIDPADQYDSGITGEPTPPMEPGGSRPNAGRNIGNPGSTPDPADEYDQPRSIGNPGATPDPADEYDQPRSIGNPGATPDPADEYDQPRSIGNPGPND